MNILQLSRTSMYPPQNGAEIRLWETAQKLSSLGDLWVAAPPNPERPDTDIEWMNITNPLFNYDLIWNDCWSGLFLLSKRHPLRGVLSNALVNTVEEYDVTFDVVVCEFPQVADGAIRLADRHNAQLLLNKHNANHEIVKGFLTERNVPGPILSRIVNNYYDFEVSAIEAADVTVFQSEDDRAKFSSVAAENSFVIPNGCNFGWIRDGGDSTAAARECGVPQDQFTCVYLGSYDYAPNRRAAEYIIEKIAPELPDVNFLLVGRNPPSAREENVYAPGYVDELPGALQLADIALCPLFSGSGTKLKMLDYFAANLPVLSTPVGVQGLDVADGTEVLIYDDLEGFVRGINRLRSSNELRSELATACSEIAAAHSWESLMDQYEDVFETLEPAPHASASARSE